MNPLLQSLQQAIEQQDHLSPHDKAGLLKMVSDAAKQWSITDFKLERTEKVKRTTAILLEQTIAELEQKRKAVEVHNRELAIEASLERVRAIALQMQQPDDMLEVCRMIAEQLEILGIKELRNVQTAIIDEHGKRIYMNYQYFQHYGKGTIEEVEIDKHPAVIAMIQRMQESPEAFHRHTFEGVELAEWKQYRNDEHQFPDPILEQATAVHFYFYSIGQGGLGLSAYLPLTEEDIAVFHRFRNVFTLAYQRFRDIEQAVAQAKEARIEAALERVRARSMAMHRSEELVEASSVFFHELNALGFDVIRTGVATVDESSETITIWSSQIVEKNEIKILGNVPVNAHPFFQGYYQAWKNQTPYFTYELVGEDLKHYYRQMSSILSYPPNAVVNPRESFNVFFFPEGTLNVITPRPMTENECQLALRFARVFGLIYRRFLDLKMAEAQAKEASIQAGLERVRSRTMAMQSCEELAETAAVVFRELIHQGIAPNRLYIALIDSDDPNEIMFYITDETGGKDCSLYSADIRRNSVFSKMHEGWHAQHKSCTLTVEGEELIKYFQYLRDELHMPLTTHVGMDKRVHQVAYFSRGFIGIASLEEQPAETISLLERFADVFNLTYTRFSDLKQAEFLAEQAELDLIRLKEEKLRTETALAELKATQDQLIHAEKMASLGELTAGIAHEIQNPLNFVNNFAEVNAELIDELHQELATGNMQLATDVAHSIKENEEKIIFHGKRADGIVKSMLQHARSSAGHKERADFNALVDEYVRLAYHGMRAKDKTFNAALETTLDPSAGQIDIVSQDIGRVLLNLLTNAFHAVAERAKHTDSTYKPAVVIYTKRNERHVLVSIADNGTGIPASALDKIFQPFYTTKPTGQGTGLGLSISYDIVHVHGGNIVVSSIEGEGTTFVVTLPL